MGASVRASCCTNSYERARRPSVSLGTSTVAICRATASMSSMLSGLPRTTVCGWSIERYSLFANDAAALSDVRQTRQATGQQLPSPPRHVTWTAMSLSSSFAARVRHNLRYDGLWWRKFAYLGCVYGPEWWKRYSPPVFAAIIFALVGRNRRGATVNMRRILG